MKSSPVFLPLLAGLASAFLVNAAEPPAQGLLLVANKGDHTLGLIDPVAGKMIATVPEDGVTGHEVVASPDGKRAFVPIYGNAGAATISPKKPTQSACTITVSCNRQVGIPIARRVAYSR